MNSTHAMLLKMLKERKQIKMNNKEILDRLQKMLKEYEKNKEDK
jgi:hypothetical protein